MRHCKLNAIELIWAQVKDYMAENTSQPFNIIDGERLYHEALAKVCVILEDFVLSQALWESIPPLSRLLSEAHESKSTNSILPPSLESSFHMVLSKNASKRRRHPDSRDSPSRYVKDNSDTGSVHGNETRCSQKGPTVVITLVLTLIWQKLTPSKLCQL